MARVSGYLRPSTLDEAVALLEQPCALVLAGGTRLNAEPTPAPVLVVDIQALGLSGIEGMHDGALRIGATATLQQIVDDVRVPVAVREGARRAGPSTLRTAATVGGCIATGEPASELLATLLVHDAVVSLAGRDGEQELPLAALLSDRARLEGRILTRVTLDVAGVTSAARTGRTRADQPIVAAIARRTGTGELRLALAGVAATPVLVANTDHLDPPSDFLGSSDYRRALAAVLAVRALEGVG